MNIKLYTNKTPRREISLHYYTVLDVFAIVLLVGGLMVCINWSWEGALCSSSVYGTELVGFVWSTAAHLTQGPATEEK